MSSVLFLLVLASVIGVWLVADSDSSGPVRF